MICKRCKCIITKKTRRVVITEPTYLRKVKAVYCRHCYKAITGKKRMADCFEYETIDIGGEINAENWSN